MIKGRRTLFIGQRNLSAHDRISSQGCTAKASNYFRGPRKLAGVWATLQSRGLYVGKCERLSRLYSSQGSSSKIDGVQRSHRGCFGLGKVIELERPLRSTTPLFQLRFPVLYLVCSSPRPEHVAYGGYPIEKVHTDRAQLNC